MNVTVMSVPDISCERCERAIASTLGPLAGVAAVDVDVDAKTVTVRHGPQFDISTALGELDAAGYEVASTLTSHDDHPPVGGA